MFRRNTLRSDRVYVKFYSVSTESVLLEQISFKIFFFLIHTVSTNKKIEPCADYKLFITFDGCEEVIYDVNEDIQQIPDFAVLKTESGLFENFQLDESRTCIYWSDRVDLPSDSLLEYGTRM